MHRKCITTTRLLALLLTKKNRALLSFCSSVKKRKSDPSVASLCQDDIVRARVSLKNKRIKTITIYEEDLCITSYGRGKC